MAHFMPPLHPQSSDEIKRTLLPVGRDRYTLLVSTTVSETVRISNCESRYVRMSALPALFLPPNVWNDVPRAFGTVIA